ncbi:S8 family serine peptidase [Flavobacterium sp.]|uniref:S8 family serine peptidase n=1 Tax=Flavobacterium sp. TaxID=239 RepID=UPI00286F9EC0|nr:S8 family serine peptidase [Flavobacterium sp.]
MKKKLVFHYFFLFFSIILLGQNNEKTAPAFRFIKERQLNKSSTTLPSIYAKAESKRVNTSTGVAESGYNCIIYTKHPEVLKTNGIAIQSTHASFVTAWLSLDQISKVAALPEVYFVDTPKFLKKNNDISVASTGASLLHAGRLDNTAYKGDGVIVAIIDTGIDWDHPDFRNPSDQTKSRILRIWDQTLTPITGETAPTGFSLGVEYTQSQINNEIDGTPAGFVREKDVDGHGTHVAGIAAGNGAALSTKYAGLAPNSDIVIIKSGDGSFDTSNIIVAFDYLKNLATSLGKPIVVNLSLGSQTGAHDGTDPLELAIDSFTDTAAGRIVVVASGNENGENIHKQIVLTGTTNASVNMQVTTASTSTSQDVFQFTAYANDTSAVTAIITAPDGTQASSLSNNGTSIMSGKARVYMSNYIDPESGDRKIQVYVTRTTTSTDVAGTWAITFSNTTSNTVTIDGWLDTKGDDFSSMAITGGDSNYLVTIPGCATKAITVGAYMAKIDWYSSSGSGYNYTNGTQDGIAGFSSIGPRRDNVQKPDITANGQAVVSCLSSDSGLANDSPYMVVNGLYRVEQGTSMATPAVAGCVALLLQKKPSATFAQIKNAIATTATKDSFTGSTDNNTWGSGKIDVFKAASSFSYCQPLARTTYNYEQAYTSATNYSYDLSSKRAAIRFTATSSGNLGGVYLKTVRTQTLTNLTIEVRATNAGIPGTLLGSIVVNPNKIVKNTWNYVDLSSLGIAITNAAEYFIVILPGSTDTFGLGQENANNTRSFISSNGTTWTSVLNLRIRPVVYANPVGAPTIALTSVAGTDTQAQCVGTAITPITYATTSVTGATFIGLPTGINGNWASNVATISGGTTTPAGTYAYAVQLTSGCDTATATGTIVIGGVPAISSVSVASGTSGTNVTINGTNLVVNSASTVTIGGISATVNSATRTMIIVSLPTGSSGGNIVVTNSCGQSSIPFVYPYSPPSNIILSTTITNENNTVGATVATLSATDLDVNDTFMYELVSGTGGTDNSNFTIVNNILKAAIVFNAQTKSTYNIRIRVTDAGGLSFEKAVVITVIGDSDSDGVRNELDLCPNTPSGVRVDFNGCEVFLLPSDNYSVLVTAASCVGQQNGAISVAAKNTSYVYLVTINGQSGFELNTSNSFKNQFSNLAPGTYEICITIQGKSNYSQCYTMKVTEPNVISVTNKMSSTGKQVTYNLNGASSYNVTFNGVTQTYTSNTLTFDLALGQNTITISTDLYCQGQYEDSIFMSEKVVFYPNPVLEHLYVYCAGTDHQVDITITTLSGKTNAIFTTVIPEGRIVDLDLKDYASGFYLVRLKGNSIDEIIKVIKK